MKVSKAIHLPEMKLRPLIEQWLIECNCKEFGIEANIASHLSDLSSLIRRDDADLLLLKEDEGDEIAGYMGLTYFKSPLGNQTIAEEHYWFVSAENRGRGGMLLIRAAKQWAKEKGCSHIIFNASNLASDMHDRLCKFYERIGMSKFETSFILQF